jgi:protease-4
VGGKFEVSGLLSKLGVQRETIASGPRANHHSPSTPWSAEELEKVDRDIEAAYRDFVSKMAEARHLPYESLERVAQGRVWTGRQALQSSLVDRLGGLWGVKAALRERLSLPADAPIRWVYPSAGRGLRPRREDLELTSGVVSWLRERLPGASDALELGLDLQGEALFALSLVQPKRDGR